MDKDIFQDKLQEWNNSKKFDDNKFNIKDNIKKIKNEIYHSNKNIHFINNKIKSLLNDNNSIIHDYMDNKWNVCSKLDQQEKDIIDKELYLKSLYITQKFWLKKNCSINYKNLVNI